MLGRGICFLVLVLACTTTLGHVDEAQASRNLELIPCHRFPAFDAVFVETLPVVILSAPEKTRGEFSAKPVMLKKEELAKRYAYVRELFLTAVECKPSDPFPRSFFRYFEGRKLVRPANVSDTDADWEKLSKDILLNLDLLKLGAEPKEAKLRAAIAAAIRKGPASGDSLSNELSTMLEFLKDFQTPIPKSLASHLANPNDDEFSTLLQLTPNQREVIARHFSSTQPTKRFQWVVAPKAYPQDLLKYESNRNALLDLVEKHAGAKDEKKLLELNRTLRELDGVGDEPFDRIDSALAERKALGELKDLEAYRRKIEKLIGFLANNKAGGIPSRTRIDLAKDPAYLETLAKLTASELTDTQKLNLRYLVLNHDKAMLNDFVKNLSIKQVLSTYGKAFPEDIAKQLAERPDIQKDNKLLDWVRQEQKTPSHGLIERETYLGALDAIERELVARHAENANRNREEALATTDDGLRKAEKTKEEKRKDFERAQELLVNNDVESRLDFQIFGFRGGQGNPLADEDRFMKAFSANTDKRVPLKLENDELYSFVKTCHQFRLRGSTLAPDLAAFCKQVITSFRLTPELSKLVSEDKDLYSIYSTNLLASGMTVQDSVRSWRDRASLNLANGSRIPFSQLLERSGLTESDRKSLQTESKKFLDEFFAKKRAEIAKLVDENGAPTEHAKLLSKRLAEMKVDIEKDQVWFRLMADSKTGKISLAPTEKAVLLANHQALAFGSSYAPEYGSLSRFKPFLAPASDGDAFEHFLLVGDLDPKKLLHRDGAHQGLKSVDAPFIPALGFVAVTKLGFTAGMFEVTKAYVADKLIDQVADLGERLTGIDSDTTKLLIAIARQDPLDALQSLGDSIKKNNREKGTPVFGYERAIIGNVESPLPRELTTRLLAVDELQTLTNPTLLRTALEKPHPPSVDFVLYNPAKLQTLKPLLEQLKKTDPLDTRAIEALRNTILLPFHNDPSSRQEDPKQIAQFLVDSGLVPETLKSAYLTFPDPVAPSVILATRKAGPPENFLPSGPKPVSPPVDVSPPPTEVTRQPTSFDWTIPPETWNRISDGVSSALAHTGTVFNAFANFTPPRTPRELLPTPKLIEPKKVEVPRPSVVVAPAVPPVTPISDPPAQLTCECKQITIDDYGVNRPGCALSKPNGSILEFTYTDGQAITCESACRGWKEKHATSCGVATKPLVSALTTKRCREKDGPATIRFSVPANATITFDGRPWNSSGANRVFTSPTLEGCFDYATTVNITVAGRTVPFNVKILANQTSRVDFTTNAVYVYPPSK